MATPGVEMKRIMVDSLHPLRFEPIFKRLVWGGRKLATVLRKPIGEGSEYAESWEISDHRLDVSRVVDGPLAGSSLRDLIRTHGEGLFGPAIGAREQFPLLVKFIDARQDLSVQVHPDDDLGRRLANDNGKTETWVIIHADPGSKIYAGLKPGTTREIDGRSGRKRARSSPSCTRSRPKPGDCILIPAGTVHAIGAGVVLAEFQQMSDATFRLHDWNRLGLDGKPRPAPHRRIPGVDRLRSRPGLARDHHARADPRRDPSSGSSRSEYFALERLTLVGPTSIGDPERFTILLGVEGEA